MLVTLFSAAWGGGGVERIWDTYSILSDTELLIIAAFKEVDETKKIFHDLL
jgi:hypothetical protein